jgi:hypothetical protein
MSTKFTLSYRKSILLIVLLILVLGIPVELILFNRFVQFFGTGSWDFKEKLLFLLGVNTTFIFYLYLKFFDALHG